MKRPDIQYIDVCTKGSLITFDKEVRQLMLYALYLERRLNDVMLGAEVEDDVNAPPHKYGGPL